MSIPAHIKYILLSLLFGLATINFIRTTLDILKSSERLDDVNKEVLGLEVKKATIEKDIQYAKTDEFVEERARNELNLIKPSEKVFVVPRVGNNAAEAKGDELVQEKNVTTSSEGGFENAKKWFDLMF